MKPNDRPLQRRFIELMDLHDGWPAVGTFLEWARDPEKNKVTNGMKSGVLGDMHQGFAVAPRHAVTLCAYFLDQRGKKALQCFSDAFTTYMKERNIADLNISSHELAEQILASETEADYMAREASGLLSLLTFRSELPIAVCECGSEDDVREAIRWQHIAAGRSLHKGHSGLSANEAIINAQKHYGITMKEFQAHALSWWEFDRWTVAFARGKRHRTGMNVVLPLTEQAYLAMKSGKRQGHEVARAELIRPSRFLLIPCSAENPAEPLAGEGNITEYTLYAILTQVAALSAMTGDEWLMPIHALSFAATPLSRYRLQKAGYKPLGVRMPGSHIEFYERTLTYKPNSLDVVLRAYIGWLQGKYGKMLRPPKYKE